ncbi:MFS transporter [Paraburkholderia adhaesiva]|uniref:MFS transporter n=1 Tax=Paraburkholderia adhaesiva TaxID=2883244 RepID=UPI001F15D38F|nr:MFS transporter [Paraburkholderia adhaesiva]
MKTTNTASGFSAVQVSAALAIGTIALLMIGIQPILLGELVDAKRVTLEGVGLVAMGEIVTLGLGVALGDLLVPVRWLRRVAIVAGLSSAAFDLLTTHASGDGPMLTVRACAGLAEGLLVWGTTGVVVRSANPTRVAAIFFVVQTLAQALVGAVLANLVIPRAGWQGGFETLAGLSLLTCGLAFVQPATLPPLASGSTGDFRWFPALLLPLFVAFLQLAAVGAFWAYMEPLGKVAGLDGRSSQTLISGVLAAQVLGGTAASLLARRVGARPVLFCASLIFIAALTTVHWMSAGHALTFGVASLLFGFVWLFALPFHVALAFQADPSGRLASLVPAAQLIGSAFGPLAASLLVQGDNATAVPLASIVFAVLATLPLRRMRERRVSAAA